MERPNFAGKKILFTAFSVVEGSEQLAAYEYVKKYGANDIATLYWGGESVKEQIPDDVTKIEIASVNDFDPELTRGYDLVFRHPPTRPDKILSPTTSGTNEFFKYCSAPIIGVTGTKGKGTCTTLIAKILEAAGKKVHLVGNIGNTAISCIDEINETDLVAFEISSFQLWDLKISPHIAVVLTMAEDHLDVHSSVEEYIEAKAQIVAHQKSDDLVFYHPTNTMSAQVVSGASGIKRRFLSDESVTIKDDKIVAYSNEIMPVSEVGLIGKHNLENITAAVAAAWEYTKDKDAIATAVANFKGLEHRLEFVRDVSGVSYYNDSFSAATPAAIAAISAFDGHNVIPIVGGYDKKVSLDAMAQAIVDKKTKHTILIGDTAHKLKDLLEAKGYFRYTLDTTRNMDGIVAAAAAVAEAGDVVVLSPGSASFDMFENYKQRGKLFKLAVKKLT